MKLRQATTMFKYLFLICSLVTLNRALVVKTNHTSLSKPKVDIEGRVVGGQDVDITQLPYTLSIEVNHEHICGASIISQYYALTAAHCVDGFVTSSIKVRGGTSVINNGGSLHDVASYSIHPSYNKANSDYDIALIQVQNKFNYNNAKQPVNIPYKEPADDTLATVSGWGSTTESGDDSIQLQAVTVPVVNRNTCILNYVPQGLVVTERMFCAGTSGKNFCGTDGGGPLVVGDTQYGIASWSIGCGRPDLYGVYTNLAESSIRLWIYTIAGV